MSLFSQSPVLRLEKAWGSLQGSRERCTGLAVGPQESGSLAVGGERGGLAVLKLSGDRVTESVRRHERKGDSCPLTALLFTRGQEVVTSNIRGQVRLPSPLSCVSTMSQPAGVSCLASHPSQTHVLLGGEDGVLGVWDRRPPQTPATLLAATGATLGEVTFHPSMPDTCSASPRVGRWCTGSAGREGTL